MMRFACLIGLLAIAFTVGAQQRDRTLTAVPKEIVAGEARHALVIGNSAYAQGPLRNPVNDARGMAKALGDAGFNVLLLEDATQAAMQRAIRTFGDRIAKGGVGLFYYAGHGIQTKGRNYLIPVNADIAREYEIEFGSIDVNLVLAMMDSAKNALNIVILDACRNNPFARNFRSLQSGLAQMDAPTGTFIAFSTAPGSVAADGADDNGVYTKHLLAEMAKPGVPIELMFKQVRNGVMSETRGQQIPWESSSMRGEFAFRPGTAQPSVAYAVAEALKVQRQEMERMLQDALERQRKDLEAAGLVPTTAPSTPAPSTPPAAAAPAVLASVQPAPLASRASLFPAQGDTWTYEIVQRDQAHLGKGFYKVSVAAATGDAILESYQMRTEGARQWAHTRERAVLGLGVSIFSPYPALLGELLPGARLRVESLESKTCGAGWNCQISGRVVGRESVRVPAGTFETIKVEISQNWTSPGQTNDRGERVARTISVWYSPQVKRAVKISSRGDLSAYVDTNYELQLLSYKLQ